MQNRKIGNALITKQLTHDVVSFIKEIGILTANETEHLFLRIATCIHQQLYVFRHATSNHEQAEQILVLIIRITVVKNLFENYNRKKALI